MQLEFGLGFVVVCLVTGIVLAFLLNRKFSLYATWINTIKKTAPLFLIFFPACFTYFVVCGSVSAFTFAGYTLAKGKSNFDRDEFLMLEKIVEYCCSFFMPLIYFRILSKNSFPGFWAYVITIVHMLAAGYRDAKLIPKISPTTSEPAFVSGPMILQNIQLMDALVPLLSLLLFLLVFKKRWEDKTKHSPQEKNLPLA